jgi:uncharacterized membrane protein
MSFLVILLLCTASAAAVRPRAGPHGWARAGLGAAFVIAGAAHLVRPLPFEQHVPDWVPAAAALVAVTGVVEIGLGAALVAWPARRRVIGLVTAGYLVAVLPANVYVAVAGVEVDGQPGGVFAWVRLPLQGVFIAWAWWSTRTTTGARSPAPLINARSPLSV